MSKQRATKTSGKRNLLRRRRVGYLFWNLLFLTVMIRKPVLAWRCGSCTRHARPLGSSTHKNKLRATNSRELRFHGDVPVFPEMSFFAPLRSRVVETIVGNDRRLSSLSEAGTNGPVPSPPQPPPQPASEGFGASVVLTADEQKLFSLLRLVRKETHLDTTLRVAGGWVRDKLLATPVFQTYHKVFDIGGQRLTSKFQKPAPSLGRQGTKVLVTDPQQSQPVDIDVALDDMLGREFADHLNAYLSKQGEKTVSVGVVLKNPEKSKHLETATMKVNSFWVDFVNLRAEEYTQDSRIPDLMRIGSASEDAFRRDLTINALFYNINTGKVEDWTGRGFEDLRRGIIATPLSPLTTLLDDPLRVLRAVRFAARLRFTMDNELASAAKDLSVRAALAQKVSRERVGGEVDLMFRSPDPVGAMRLLINLELVETVFPYQGKYAADEDSKLMTKGLELLSTAHDHLADCRLSPPLWCVNKVPNHTRLVDDDEGRRLLWYAAFLKPLYDHTKRKLSSQGRVGARSKKANRSVATRLLVDDLKRPVRDADAVEKVLKAANEFSQLINSGCDVSATMVLLSEVQVYKDESGQVQCRMGDRTVHSATEEDPIWVHAMEFRQLCASSLKSVGQRWRASLVLAISEHLASVEGLDYAIEGDVVEESQDELRRGILERFDSFAAAMQQLGLIGVWDDSPLMNGQDIKKILPGIPKGPAFRDVMAEQEEWMISHPGAPVRYLEEQLISVFPDYAE